ncbi:MAG TPA: Ig-like domain-containing protein [Mesotoga sp.]|nr:Ig-like domain-containing protein [Mesotoga sp.]HQC56927.1 Ig-like domain-containing protein [Mesotoga sp.]
MKKWMIYTLIAAVAVAIVLIATIPALLNKEPVMELPVQVVNQGEKLTVDLRAFIKDEKADEVTLEKVDGPGTITGSVFTFEPAFKYVGEVIAKIKATDKQGKNSTGELKINVIRVNRPPEIDTTPLKVLEGESMSLDLLTIVKDPDNDELSLAVDGPGKLEGNTYVYAPGYLDAGKKVLRITAKDSEGNETVRDVQLEVVDVNAPPALVVSDQTVREGDSLAVDLAALVSDAEGDGVTLTLIEGPGEIVDGVFIYKPGFAEAGESVVSISAKDSRGGESTSTFKVTVTETNRPPRIFLSDMVISEGEELVVDLSSRLIDPDNDPLEITVEGPGAVQENRYVYTPGYRDAGDKTVTIMVSDGKGGTGRASFTILVQDANRPPEGSIANETIFEGERLNLYLKAFAYDPDGDGIFFELLEGPGSVEGDSYTYEPDFESAGLKEVKIKVSDSNGEEKILVFEIDVVDVNRAPVAVLPSIAASIKETFTLGLDLKSFFTDPDGEELSFAILEGPGSIEGGNYKYTPSYNDQGEKTVTIVARDSSGLSANLPIIISVMDLNRSPRILLSDKIIDEGANLVVDLRMQSIDLDGDELTFTLVEGPGSVENAIYTFEPSFDESGDHTVTIQVSDGLASVTGEFMVEVVDVNRTPETTIKEIKSSIREGFSLGMNLTTFFSDPDGDELTLSLEGPGTLEGNGYTYSPGYEDSGEKFILVTASDGRGGGVTLPIIITVLDVNRLPEIKEPFPEVTLEEGKTVEIELGDFISDPDGDDLLFEIREGPGSIVDGKYVFEPRTGEAGQKDVMIKVSDGKSELTVPLKIFVEAGHRVVSITYALFSSGIDKVKLVAGSHEIISSGQRAELEVDWPLDFDTVSIWKVTEESAEFIGAARITASSSSRNIPVVSEGGETKGSVRIELK